MRDEADYLKQLKQIKQHVGTASWDFHSESSAKGEEGRDRYSGTQGQGNEAPEASGPRQEPPSAGGGIGSALGKFR